MKHEMYVVFDKKSQIYNKPFYFINHAVAVRAARELLLDTTSEITRHPEDFAMFHVGTYDDETAEIQVAKIQDIIVRFHELAAIMPRPINPEQAHPNMEIAS